MANKAPAVPVAIGGLVLVGLGVLAPGFTARFGALETASFDNETNTVRPAAPLGSIGEAVPDTPLPEPGLSRVPGEFAPPTAVPGAQIPASPPRPSPQVEITIRTVGQSPRVHEVSGQLADQSWDATADHADVQAVPVPPSSRTGTAPTEGRMDAPVDRTNGYTHSGRSE